MSSKAMVVDAGALERKYGGRAGEVWQAVEGLTSADEGRGVQSMLVKLDDPNGPVGGAAIDSGAGWVEVKGAIDALARETELDYLVLLGGPDVLPHCDLDNPAGNDGDPSVPSDLPYACAAPASGSVADFIAPTRVVSRIPDVPGATEPDVLLQILGSATNWEGRERERYESYLGISAQVWEDSTRQSLTQTFGNANSLHLSPHEGPDWTGTIEESLSHFANLHGAPASAQYFGQETKTEFPVAHDAALVDGRVLQGTIAAVEACYGGELFAPLDGQIGIPLAYLRSGAYGFFGSTTIAYGPAVGNDYADIICRLFLEALLGGASVGRAGLEARQQYAATAAPLDPIDLKTLAQFLVLGDASVHPVAILEDAIAPAAKSDRRKRLRETGKTLVEIPTWSQPLEVPDDGLLATLREVAGVPNAGEASIASFSLSTRGEAHGLQALAFAPGGGEGAAEPETAPATMHLLVQEIEIKDAPMTQRVAVLAIEEEGRLISVKTATTR
jgi:hypothetical protein